MKPSTAELFAKVYERQDEMWVPIMFSPSEKSRAAGWRYLEGIRERRDRDAQVSVETASAHQTAAGVFGRPNSDNYAYLKRITSPTLVVNGQNDTVISTVNSFILQQNLPDAKLMLYPESNHGAHYQYHEDFVAQVPMFLDRSLPNGISSAVAAVDVEDIARDVATCISRALLTHLASKWASLVRRTSAV